MPTLGLHVPTLGQSFSLCRQGTPVLNVLSLVLMFGLAKPPALVVERVLGLALAVTLAIAPLHSLEAGA